MEDVKGRIFGVRNVVFVYIMIWFVFMVWRLKKRK